MSRATVEKTESQASPIPAQAPVLRWYWKSALLLLSIILLSFSFAPFNQFYLAWIGLAPMLVVVAHCRSARTAFFWIWVAATVFFAANMWWLIYVTGPGMAALVVLLGVYWAAPMALLRGAGILKVPLASATPPRSGRIAPPGDAILPLRGGVALATLPMPIRMLLIAVVWVGFEWLRGTWPLNGLPWLFLGHTQSPALLICQIADVAGVAGITFLLVLANAAVALAILDRSIRRMRVAAGVLLACILATILYGKFRFSQESAATSAGPRVLVVQADVPQSNSGNKGESADKLLEFHLKSTKEALDHAPPQNLVVWSETMAPPVNPELVNFSLGYVPPDENLFYWALQSISNLTAHYHVNLLTGAMRWTGGAHPLSWEDNQVHADDRRNVADLFNDDGQLVQRYDKIHLVPFGEYMPFEHSVPILYHLLMKLNPYGADSEYTLTPGDPNVLTVFKIHDDSGHAWRLVSPICFEDIDAPLVRRMFAQGGEAGGKAADFIVNVTNDGWFKGGENAQHLQASIFRAIENRAPIARSVNTGISGFVDSMGRISDVVPVRTVGTAWEQIRPDSRITFFTRYGDLFAILCAIATGGLSLACLSLWLAGIVRRKARRTIP